MRIGACRDMPAQAWTKLMATSLPYNSPEMEEQPPPAGTGKQGVKHLIKNEKLQIKLVHIFNTFK
jgi:hypothetical protein